MAVRKTKKSLNNIPNISFKSCDGATDIEFLRLSELFSQIEKHPSHDPKKPHRITFFALLIVTKGNGVHQVDLKNYPIQEGSVIKIAKGQVHAFQDNFQYDGYLVVFTEDFVLRYFSKSSVDYISHLYNYHLSEPLVDNSTFNDFFLEQITTELRNIDTYAQKEIVAKIVELYLLKLERLAHENFSVKRNKKHQAIFIHFKDLVERNYLKTRNVMDYAVLLTISSKHLNHIVREITFCTAKQFIDQYVILEIKRDLFGNGTSLKEVAYQNGFDEVTNFSKFFKKHTGLSPKAYKATL